MQQLTYLDETGAFILRNAQRYGEVYFPLVNEGGMMSSVTPLLAGDCKSGQNCFLLAPASEDSLRSGRDSRNFWVRVNGGRPWSVTGQSAPQQGQRFDPDCEEEVLTAGLLWQRVTRENRTLGLRASVLSFVPAGQEKIEIMQVTLTNIADRPLELAPTAAIPLYARSADNLRDHRHVTSLLHRVELRRHGLELVPTLTFDERGHQPGQMTYRVWGGDETGAPPQGFLALAKDFVGEGSWDWPEAVVCPRPETWLHAGQSAQGGEMAAALFFPTVTLDPGEARRYQIVLAIGGSPAPCLTPDGVDAALAWTQAWWQAQVAQTVRTGNPRFDAWMRWVAVQPVLRRICGCSFLPHHDYGRGGRGWRDLWQDSLALLDYCALADRAWKKAAYPAQTLAEKLEAMARWLRGHIAATEWVGDGVSLHWYNSYYDNSGRQVEGLRGDTARMMLTGQVFTILSGAADEGRVREIIRAADWYLFQPQRGGYCLNTDFGEVKLDMGRMFGFAYGHKENGAVFSHMAVMYAYALYVRGFAAEGWRVLRQLFLQSDDFPNSRLLPGIPEYFDGRGRGMYPYLTGAGSWLLLTMQTQVFGVRGQNGDLLLEPKLRLEQFDVGGTAELCCTAAGRRLRVQYENPRGLDFGQYRLKGASCGGRRWMGDGGRLVIPRDELPDGEKPLELTAELVPAGKGDD